MASSGPVSGRPDMIASRVGMRTPNSIIGPFPLSPLERGQGEGPYASRHAPA